MSHSHQQQQQRQQERLNQRARGGGETPMALESSATAVGRSGGGFDAKPNRWPFFPVWPIGPPLLLRTPEAAMGNDTSHAAETGVILFSGPRCGTGLPLPLVRFSSLLFRSVPPAFI